MDGTTRTLVAKLLGVGETLGARTLSSDLNGAETVLCHTCKTKQKPDKQNKKQNKNTLALNRAPFFVIGDHS